MFDLSKIISGLNDLKTIIEKNRVKNLRAEIAARIYVNSNDITLGSKNNLEPLARESVFKADILLEALGETNA